MNKEILALVIIIGFFALGASLYPNTQNKDLKTFKVAYQSEDYISGSLIEMAKDLGYFEKEGLIVEADTSATAVNVGLSSGEVDATVASTPGSLVEFYNNKDIVFLSKLSSQPPYHGVIAKKGNFKEMKKAAVVRRGGTVQVYTDMVAESLGNKNKLDYVVAPVGAPQIAALKSGSVDFIVANIYNADFDAFLSDNEFQIISPTKSWGKFVSPTGVISTRKRLAQDEASVEGFIKAINKAQEYALDNPKKLNEKLMSLYEFSQETAESLLSEFKRTASKDHKAVETDFDIITLKIKEFDPRNPDRSLSEYIDYRFVD